MKSNRLYALLTKVIILFCILVITMFNVHIVLDKEHIQKEGAIKLLGMKIEFNKNLLADEARPRRKLNSGSGCNTQMCDASVGTDLWTSCVELTENPDCDYFPCTCWYIPW